jgi:hypothetical protein
MAFQGDYTFCLDSISQKILSILLFKENSCFLFQTYNSAVGCEYKKTVIYNLDDLTIDIWIANMG